MGDIFAEALKKYQSSGDNKNPQESAPSGATPDATSKASAQAAIAALKEAYLKAVASGRTKEADSLASQIAALCSASGIPIPAAVIATHAQVEAASPVVASIEKAVTAVAGNVMSEAAKEFFKTLAHSNGVLLLGADDKFHVNNLVNPQLTAVAPEKLQDHFANIEYAVDKHVRDRVIHDTHRSAEEVDRDNLRRLEASLKMMDQFKAAQILLGKGEDKVGRIQRSHQTFEAAEKNVLAIIAQRAAGKGRNDKEDTALRDQLADVLSPVQKLLLNEDAGVMPMVSGDIQGKKNIFEQGADALMAALPKIAPQDNPFKKITSTRLSL